MKDAPWHEIWFYPYHCSHCYHCQGQESTQARHGPPVICHPKPPKANKQVNQLLDHLHRRRSCWVWRECHKAMPWEGSSVGYIIILHMCHRFAMTSVYFHSDGRITDYCQRIRIEICKLRCPSCGWLSKWVWWCPEEKQKARAEVGVRLSTPVQSDENCRTNLDEVKWRSDAWIYVDTWLLVGFGMPYCASWYIEHACTTQNKTLYIHIILSYMHTSYTTKFHDRLHMYIYCIAGSFWFVDWISYVPRPFASSKPLWRRIPRLISESHTALHTPTLLRWKAFFLTIEAHVVISRIRYLHGTCTLDTFAWRWMYPSFCQVQDKGIAFIPDTWSTKFKPVLGPLSWFGLHVFSTSIAWSVHASPIHESQGHIENLQGAQFFLELGEARFHRTVTQSVED